jgi:hypothetical protein
LLAIHEGSRTPLVFLASLLKAAVGELRRDAFAGRVARIFFASGSFAEDKVTEDNDWSADSCQVAHHSGIILTGYFPIWISFIDNSGITIAVQYGQGL